MKVTNDLLQELIKRVDVAVESLMIKLASQEQEIIKLKDENKRLRDNYTLMLEEIKQYITELEQIKSHYVDSNYNIKQ